MTQITVEQGDNPQVHAYAPVKKKWRELGEVECPLIDSMRAEKDRLVFECEETDETGKFYKVEKMLAFGGVTGVMPATLERNARSAQRGGASARLEGALGGDEDKWDRVRITRGKTRRSIKAN